MQEIYYKLVTVVRSDLYSYRFFFKNLFDKYNIRYEVGNFVYPKVLGTKLYCFQSQKYALDYLDECSMNLQFGGIKLFKCECINPKTDEANLSANLSEMMMDAFYNNIDLEYNNRVACPNGTIVCDGIKLLEEVSQDEIL